MVSRSTWTATSSAARRAVSAHHRHGAGVGGRAAPRLLRAAGQIADGTITWMANARAVGELVASTIRAPPATRAVRSLEWSWGSPLPSTTTSTRLATAAQQFAIYGGLPNYRRVLAAGGLDAPAEAALVGDEDAVTRAVESLFAAGATDVWAAPFPVGDDAPRHASGRAPSSSGSLSPETCRVRRATTLAATSTSTHAICANHHAPIAG